MWRKVACAAVLGSCLPLAACAGPVPDEGAYRHAALQTSMAMVSDLVSGQLAAQLGLRGSSFPAFTDGNVTDAENDADSVDSTFGSRQPPDAVRRAAAEDAAGPVRRHQRTHDLRVAVRIEDRPQVRKALGEVGKSLKTFNDLQQELQ